MAQPATNKKTSASRPRKSTGTQQQHNTKPPRRRAVMAIICFLLGIFAFIGYFDAEPVFINFLTNFVRRIIGPGYFALPPALIMCSVILAFHKGRPVMLRSICTLSLTIVTGSLIHLFMRPPYTAFGELWSSGAEMLSGGIISGSIAELLIWLVGAVGATIAIICVAVVLGMIAFNATFSSINRAFRDRERREYVPEPELEPPPTTQYVAPHGVPAQTHGYQKRSVLTPLWKRKKIDIPIDERAPIQDHFVDDVDNKTVGANSSSDTLKKQTASIETIPESDDVIDDNVDASDLPEDLPIDIPFMDGRLPRKAPLIPPIIEELFDPIDPPPPVVSKKSNDAKPVKTPATAKKSKASAFDLPVDEPQPKSETKASAFDLALDSPQTSSDGSYVFPPLNLLSRGDPASRSDDSEVKANTERLEDAFESFGVHVNITNATRGPSVTRYEAALEAGVKLNKITGLADDIALSLGAVGVRIAAMPNRISTVGIEVPNKTISSVNLRDIIESKEFRSAESKLTFAIGMDITGDPIVGDVSKLPHMLVAGTTGSGKSVCLNSIILSILYKAAPDDVRFIMIDPKMVEFRVYNDIPHLLVPVVTDVKKAAGALQWATFEMMKRYTLFSEANARDIASYNKIVEKSSDEDAKPIPKIVVVIDELADLMMTAAKEVEESICRIAQMGRAAGIHLIIATQSPRADVITGLMKANIPSRIALKVSSALESRIILDSGHNADKLVGNGDMLYAPTGTSKPMRLQGTWVSDSEREQVIEFIMKSGETQYSEEVMGEIEKAATDKSSGDKSASDAGSGDYDDLLPQAVDVIFETNQASVSMLQRRLKLGYARAARIVDQMEELGVVGQFEGSKPRAILITREQWKQMQYVSGVAPVDQSQPDYVQSVSEQDEY